MRHKAAASNSPLRLHRLDAAAASDGVCLDGSPPAYFYAPGNGSAWLVFLKGGGWCMDAEACRYRSTMREGTTLHLPSELAMGGLLSADPAVNPTFHAFHRAYLWYCDGSMFTGAREAPLVVANTTIFLRGRRVLDALLRALLERGLAAATHVLFAGHSAGGLAATIHADAVRAALPDAAVVKAASVSGFFLLHRGGHDAAGGGPRDRIFLRGMRDAFALHESGKGGVAAACLAARPAAEAWRCFFANGTAPSTRTPLFLLSSSLDSWQLANVWRSDATCARSCLASARACQGADARERLERFSRAFVADVRAGWLARPGNGAFVTSCCEHDAFKSDAAWARYAVGGVAMRDALARWWTAPADAPPTAHTHLPCELRRGGSGGGLQCNPSCAAYERASSVAIKPMRFTPRVKATADELAHLRTCRSHYMCRLPQPVR